MILTVSINNQLKENFNAERCGYVVSAIHELLRKTRNAISQSINT
jgi:hypothetical protein